MPTITFRQEMTMWDKGHIFTLYDDGTMLDDITLQTNYPTWRLKCLIEGVNNTNAWKIAKETYAKESNDQGITHGKTSNVNYSQRKKKTNSTKHSSPGWCANQELDLRISGVPLPEYNSIGRTSTSRHAHKRSEMSNQSRRTGTIIDGLRKHVDYKGE